MDGLKALENMLFLDNVPMFDMVELITLWESEPGEYHVNDGNHYITLFMRYGNQSWPCQIISLAFRMTAVDIRKMAEFCSSKQELAL